jgi:diguanylate cyclase (GGDEF)-like protein
MHFTTGGEWMLNFDWQVWLVHLLLELLMTLGYMAMHNSLWELGFADESSLTRVQKRWMRTAIPLIDLFIMVSLAYGYYMDPMNDHLYQNMQLVVISIQLLDDRLTTPEFVTRTLLYAGFVFWSYLAYNHSLPQLVMGWVQLAIFAVVLRRMHHRWHYDYRAVLPLVTANGLLYWLFCAQVYLHNRVMSAIIYVVVMMFAFLLWTSSHNDRVRRAELKKLADFDSLTNAKTYARFHLDSIRLVAAAQRTAQPLTMVMLDIDHFKVINDRYGHLSGNDVLVGVATLLDQVLSASGLNYQIYRTGGEEFNIVFPGSSISTAIAVVRDCWARVRTNAFKTDTSSVHISISVGVTGMRPDEGAQTLFRRADNSLYLSKRRGRDTITVEENTLQINDQQPTLFNYTYFAQPIADIRSGQTLRSELLLRLYDDMVNRWRLPQSFNIPATTMVNLLDRVLRQLPQRAVNLNLLPEQFLNLEVTAALCRFATVATLDGPLQVELVELPELEQFKYAARAYHEAGIKIIIDDVGSDNSYAASRDFLPFVDGVKFAMQNLRDDHDDDALQAKIEFWLQLAATHHLSFVLEGIETENDVRVGQKLGVTRGQGYYYAKPVLPYLHD